MTDTTNWTEVAIESCMAHPEAIDVDHDIATIRHYGSPEYGGAESVDGCCDRIEAHVRTLQSRLDQAHWDAISRDQTIENLRAENARLRTALEWYADDGNMDAIGLHMDTDPEDGQVVADLGSRARAALGEGVTP
jgi:hypothetical protein